MQLMGVEGLTRENVASHLQKYRLQLRKDGKDVDGNDDHEDDDHQNAVNFLADAATARRTEDDSGGAAPCLPFPQAARFQGYALDVLPIAEVC